MTNEEFVGLPESTVAKRGEATRALWLGARGDWDAAHALAQQAGEAGDPAGDWVHAHLHRVEGDEGNAAYWYVRAGRRAPQAGTSFAAEREAMLAEFFRDGRQPG